MGLIRRQIGRLIALCMLAGSLVVGAAVAGEPTGHFCGKLKSDQSLVAVRTIFAPGDNGRLSGTYEFDDLGKTTKGTLRERPGGVGATRTFEWLDRYGTGMLTITFDAEYDSFEGNWAAGDATPDQSWTGKRCAEKFTTARSFAFLLTTPTRLGASPVITWQL